MTHDVSGLIKAKVRTIPQIYVYTTPEIAAHDGWTKIGYTEQDVDTRIKRGEILLSEAVPYQLCAEQEQAVAEALDYSRLH